MLRRAPPTPSVPRCIILRIHPLGAEDDGSPGAWSVAGVSPGGFALAWSLPRRGVGPVNDMKSGILPVTRCRPGVALHRHEGVLMLAIPLGPVSAL